MKELKKNGDLIFRILVFCTLLVLSFGISFSSMALEEGGQKTESSGTIDKSQSLELVPENLNVLLNVKEVAGVGVQEYPTTVVVPLPYGMHYDVNSFRVVDASGDTVPAQFDVLNRWWTRDKSIRHVTVNFQPTVEAFTSGSTGISRYYLRDDGTGNSTDTLITVKDGQESIEVNTGPLKFTVNKERFTIIDELWLDSNNNAIFEDSEQLIITGKDSGGVFVGRLEGDVQLDSSRSDVKVVVEESGPMRVVIRAEALTEYIDTDNHTHGFAVRIYAYANKPFVKIDYQLQNSAKNKRNAWALYFEEMNINFKLNLDINPTVHVGSGDGSVYKRTRSNGIYLAQESHDIAKVYDVNSGAELRKSNFSVKSLSNTATGGFVDVSDSRKGVSAMIRYFWQTWPNGLAINKENRLSLELFPRWSAQISPWKRAITPIGLYWLEDMQQTYKETLLYFHGPDTSDTKIQNLSKTFNYNPVVTLQTSWYQKTQATLDMGGVVPFKEKVSKSDDRMPGYSGWDFNFNNKNTYKFNWDNFYLKDKNRKLSPAMGGGWPFGAAQLIATENPTDYYFAQNYTMGELNSRPHWMAGYTYELDYNTLQLNARLQQAPKSWRQHGTGNKPEFLDADYLSGTGQASSPRNDDHAWYYHVEEAYYFTANPWIRDWYEFIGEVRKGKLFDPSDNNLSSRSNGHMIANAIQAYRVTGDTSILDGVRNYLVTRLMLEQSPLYGYRNSLSSGQYGEAAFEAGYLLRAVINYMEEVRGTDWQAYAEAFQFVSGYMEWNYNFSNFSYYTDAKNGEIGKSNSTSMTFLDPQAWYYLHTGKRKYLDHLNKYINTGINGGKPSGNLKEWQGQWEGRFVQFVHENDERDTIPPDAIEGLEIVRTGTDNIKLTWTTPLEAFRFHIVYSEKPISEDISTDTNMTNWWAAKVVGPDLTAKPGEKQSFGITVDRDIDQYVAIFTFDENDNMSAMSNLAHTSTAKTTSSNSMIDTEVGSTSNSPIDIEEDFESQPLSQDTEEDYAIEDEEYDLQMDDVPYASPEVIWLERGRNLTKLTKGFFTVKVRVEGIDEQKTPKFFPRIRYHIGAFSNEGYFDMVHEGENVWRFNIPNPGWYHYRSKSLHYQVRVFDEESVVPIAESSWGIELIDSFIKDYN
ncbi:MAG: hypothetical protein GY777_18000 [Candidatus Brocadiaceae bacterium]|nr:hypothetical protein [Candidatus Brocadiaceae bacterium]